LDVGGGIFYESIGRLKQITFKQRRKIEREEKTVMSIEAVGLVQPDQISSELPPRIFNHSAGEFATDFNRAPFQLSHNLADHPLFEIPRLTELAKQMWVQGGGNVTFHVGEKPIDERWDNVKRQRLSILDAIAEIETSGSWILIKSIQNVPEYDAVLKKGMEELKELIGEHVDEEIAWLDAYLFIASPHAVTPYHIDAESTFLMQIHGEKDYNLIDPNDRSILTEEEIEGYYVGDLSAATFKEECQGKAFVVHMAPGVGLHQPARSPHWVKNGDDFSVTLSFLFLTHEYAKQARIYQANHYLRKLGMSPTQPGRSAMRDGVKKLVFSNLWHKPKSKYELLRYGHDKYKAPINFVRKLAQPSAQHKRDQH
jgi:hypothetical protein